MNKKSAMGQRIQELRKDAGLTQEQLAQRIGVSMAAVRNYENGLGTKLKSDGCSGAFLQSERGIPPR